MGCEVALTKTVNVSVKTESVLDVSLARVMALVAEPASERSPESVTAGSPVKKYVVVVSVRKEPISLGETVMVSVSTVTETGELAAGAIVAVVVDSMTGTEAFGELAAGGRMAVFVDSVTVVVVVG